MEKLTNCFPSGNMKQTDNLPAIEGADSMCVANEAAGNAA